MRSVGSSSAVSLVASIVVRHCASTGSSSSTPSDLGLVASDLGLVASPPSTAVSPRTWERRARELARQRPKELDQLIQRELSQFAQPGSGVTLRSQSQERPQNQHPSKRLNVLISISQSWEQALRLATFASALQTTPVTSGSSSSSSEGGPVMSLARLTAPARANVIAQLCLAGKHEQVNQLCQLKPSAAAAAGGGGASNSAAVPSPQPVAVFPTKTRGRQSVRESRLVSRRLRHAIDQLTVLEDVQGLNTLLRMFDAEARPLLLKNNLQESAPLRSALFGLHYTPLLELATQAVCALLTPQKRLLPLLAAIHAASTLAKLSPGHMLPLSVQRLWAEHYSHIPSSYLRNVDPLLVQSAFRSWTTEAAPGALLLIPSSQFLDLWQQWQQVRPSLLAPTSSDRSSSSPPLTVLESTAILRQVEGATPVASLSAQQKNDVREVFRNCWDTQDTRVRQYVRKWLLGSRSGRKLCHALRVNMVELLVAPLLSFTTPYNCVSFAARPAVPATKSPTAISTKPTSSPVPSQQRALSRLLRRLLTPQYVSRYGPSVMGALADQLFVSERTAPDRDRSTSSSSYVSPRLEAHLERDQQRLVSIWKKSCPTKLRFLLILLERELQHCTDRGLTAPCRQRAAYRLFELLRVCDKVSMPPLPLEEKTKFGVALLDSGVSFEKIRQWLGAPNPHGCGGNKQKRCTRSSQENEASVVTELKADETAADFHLNLLRLAAESNTTRVRRHGLHVSSPNRSQMLALWSLLRCAEVPEVTRRKLLSHFICHRPGDPTSDGGLLHALWPCHLRQRLDVQHDHRSTKSSHRSSSSSSLSDPQNHLSLEKVVEQRHRQVLVDALYSMSTEPVMRRMLDARPNPQWQRLADAEGISFLAKQHAE